MKINKKQGRKRSGSSALLHAFEKRKFVKSISHINSYFKRTVCVQTIDLPFMLSRIKEKSGLNSSSKKREGEKKDVTKATILYRNISKTSVHSPKYSIIH